MQLLTDQNAILELVAKGADVASILDRLAHVVGRVFPEAGCSICLIDENQKYLRYMGGARLPSGFDPLAGNPNLRDAASPATFAALRSEPVVVSDMTEESLWATYRPHALEHGINACWSQPILSQNGESLGSIDLHFSVARMPQSNDYQLIDALSPLARIIVENNRRAQDLQSANDRLVSLAASIPGVVYQRIVTPEGDIRYTYISEGAQDLFGVSPAEILANPDALFDRHSPEYRATFRDKLLKASKNLDMWDVEASIISRSGEHKWTHAIARPHRQSDGTVVWNGIILNATRIKQAYLALAASNRAKNEFLANMSHELRTPLNAVIGFSDMIRSELAGPIGNPQYKSYAEDIYSSGAHLLEVINDILDLAKIEAGNIELNEGVLNVAHTIETCLNLAKDRAYAHNITLAFDADDTTILLRGDERKMKQILNNLLSNAIKFTADGGHVGISFGLNGGGGLTIAITDTGIGISEEYMDKIFDPFLQADGSLSRKFQGSGLGLSLTKGMVELHQGFIHIKSEVNVGTKVTVSFPADRVLNATPKAERH